VLADHEAEKALVYVAIWTAELSPRSTGIAPEEFDHPGWREVWRAALAVEAAGHKRDALAVAEHMKARGVLEGSGGPAGLMATLELLPPVWDPASPAERVKELASLRQLRQLGLAIAREAEGANTPAAQLALRHAAHLQKVAASGNRQTTTFRAAVEECLDQYHGVRAGTYQEYLPTGTQVWDEVLQGLQRWKHGLLGAYPSVGKGAVMLRAILNAAQMGRKPGLFSLEDLKVWMAKRYLSAASGVPARRLMQAERLSERAEHRIEEALNACHGWADNILVEDSSALSDEQIAVTARQWVVAEGCTEVWIDNASEVDTSGAPGERTDLRVGRMVRLFRDVAKDLNVPVWLLVHFKQPENSTKDEPRFIVPTSSMWKNSGAFAEAARNAVALFLDKQDPEGFVLGKVTKQSEGAKDSVFAMRFNASAGLVESRGGSRRQGDVGYSQNTEAA
jgi:replicative DNA helicase